MRPTFYAHLAETEPKKKSTSPERNLLNCFPSPQIRKTFSSALKKEEEKTRESKAVYISSFLCSSCIWQAQRIMLYTTTQATKL